MPYFMYRVSYSESIFSLYHIIGCGPESFQIAYFLFMLFGSRFYIGTISTWLIHDVLFGSLYFIAVQIAYACICWSTYRSSTTIDDS